MKIYVDTSVIGGCFDAEFGKWSNELFDTFRSGKNQLVISDIVMQELEKAPERVKNLIDEIESKISLSVNEKGFELANLYIKDKAITQKYYNDGLHIAIATIYNVDVLVSWNFKHIVSLDKIRLFNAVNLKYGYKPIEIRTPMEVVQ